MKRFLVRAGDHLVKLYDFSTCKASDVYYHLSDLFDGMRFFLPKSSDHPDFSDLWDISLLLLEDDPDPISFKLAYFDIFIWPCDDSYKEIQKENILIFNHGLVQHCTNICDDREELPFSESKDEVDEFEYWFPE